MDAAVPKCDNGHGAGFALCGRPMRWANFKESGVWSCPVHGPQFKGFVAAERAGYRSARIIEEAA